MPPFTFAHASTVASPTLERPRHRGAPCRRRRRPALPCRPGRRCSAMATPVRPAVAGTVPCRSRVHLAPLTWSGILDRPPTVPASPSGRPSRSDSRESCRRSAARSRHGREVASQRVDRQCRLVGKLTFDHGTTKQIEGAFDRQHSPAIPAEDPAPVRGLAPPAQPALRPSRQRDPRTHVPGSPARGPAGRRHRRRGRGPVRALAATALDDHGDAAAGHSSPAATCPAQPRTRSRWTASSRPSDVRIVAVEVKAGATVRSEDLHGLRRPRRSDR